MNYTQQIEVENQKIRDFLATAFKYGNEARELLHLATNNLTDYNRRYYLREAMNSDILRGQALCEALWSKNHIRFLKYMIKRSMPQM